MGVLRSFSLLWSRCTLMIWMVWIMIQDAPVNTESVVNKYNSGDNSVKLVQLVTNMGPYSQTCCSNAEEKLIFVGSLKFRSNNTFNLCYIHAKSSEIK